MQGTLAGSQEAGGHSPKYVLDLDRFLGESGPDDLVLRLVLVFQQLQQVVLLGNDMDPL